MEGSFAVLYRSALLVPPFRLFRVVAFELPAVCFPIGAVPVAGAVPTVLVGSCSRSLDVWDSGCRSLPPPCEEVCHAAGPVPVAGPSIGRRGVCRSPLDIDLSISWRSFLFVLCFVSVVYGGPPHRSRLCR